MAEVRVGPLHHRGDSLRSARGKSQVVRRKRAVSKDRRFRRTNHSSHDRFQACMRTPWEHTNSGDGSNSGEPL